MLSVVIPTRNRCAILRDALESIVAQGAESPPFEVIVVDNGSEDSTRQVVSSYQQRFPGKVNYLYVETPGLHVGRHFGASHARGDVITYCDDDIIATPGWLYSIWEAFRDRKVNLVGGKILPRWEANMPSWLDSFQRSTEHGWWLGYLSILDFGEQRIEVSPSFIFGCNFSIRKKTLFECGGFHPDGMPRELVRYRGDGETALARKVAAQGMAAIYEPGVTVYHRVPCYRLTIEYFENRAFKQGVSDSFSKIRSHSGGNGGAKWDGDHDRRRVLKNLKDGLSLVFARLQRKPKYPGRPEVYRVQRAYLRGYRFHQNEVHNDPALLEWVCKEHYLDEPVSQHAEEGH